MRPHQLTITAMGPYAGTATVDFDDLATEGLFLICGPTGSGKTSLLDALCFALYGEVPGRRDDRGLKSDHAGPGITPEVSLTFTAQGSAYRIVRQPFHTSVKKRGAGLTERQPTATLQRIDAAGPHTVATKLREVRLEVERLVGLTPTEFQQVILLPQGKFQAVLQGQPEQREALLKTLFDTAGFERMTDWLADEAKARRAKVTSAQQETGRLGSEARRVGGVLSLGPDSAGTADSLFPPDDRGAPDQAGLDRLVERAAELLRDAEEARGESHNTVDRNQSELDTRRAAADQWDAKKACEATHGRLRAEAGAIKAGRRRRDRADAANQLRPSLEDAARRSATQRLAATAAERARRGARTAATNAPLLPEALAAPDREAFDQPGQIAEARRQVSAATASLESLRTIAASGADAANRAAQMRSAIAEDERARVTADHDLDALQQKLAALDLRIRHATTASDKVEGLGERARVHRSQARAARQLLEIRSHLETARVEHLDAVRAAQDAKAAALDLRQRRLDQIAAELAGRLADGDGCMVCGSVEHPAPAQAKGATATAEQVEAAEAVADELAAAAARVGDHVTGQERKEAASIAAAGDGAADPATAHRRAEQAEADHEQACARAEELGHFTARAEKLRAQHTKIEADQSEIANRLGATTTEADHLEHTAREALSRVELTTGPGVTLDGAVAGLGRLDQALADATLAVDQHATARDLRIAADARLGQDLTASSFATPTDAEQALLSDDDRAALSEQITAHENEMTVVLDKLDDPVWATLPPERPDVDDARRSVREAQLHAEQTVTWSTKVHGAHERLDQIAHEHRNLRRALVAAEEDAALYEAVANRCGGKVAPKISLQRWVLAAYLEGICEHANQRLTAMTAGRYRLLVTRQGATAASRAGLDLWVHDAHTGTERPVASLSGGETFQASLALALGVADSIQARSGGIRLDALFVDEGFGSLDPEALALAMDELDGLRAGGRMVGLISHVGTMRERIHHGIEITATAEGSTLSVGRLDAA